MDTLRGIVHGRMIELENEPGLPDGQSVMVVVQPMNMTKENGEGMAPGDGLRRAFGSWADDAEELDEYLVWNRRQRRIGREELEQ